MGGPKIKWEAGRTDFNAGEGVTPDGRLPDATQGTLRSTPMQIHATDVIVCIFCRISNPKMVCQLNLESTVAWQHSGLPSFYEKSCSKFPGANIPLLFLVYTAKCIRS